MKNVLIVLMIMMMIGCLTTTATAQFEIGKNYLGPRVGIGAYGSGLAFGAAYEYGVTPEIGVGGLLDYYSYDWGYGISYTFIDFGIQGNYHFGKLLKWDNKLDPYAGLVLGYESVHVNGLGVYSAAYSSGLQLGGQAGLRYFLSPHVALFGQVGFGYTYLKVGVDFKF